MKFGVREICDVVFRAKTTMEVGSKTFYKHEPVIYFDSLKTSSLEGAVTTVYAQGGKGNSRLMAWDGEKTLTFTMEDALISPLGLKILAGAELLEAGKGEGDEIYVHTTEQTKKIEYTESAVTITLDDDVTDVYSSDTENLIYVMALDEKGAIISEPYCVGVTAEGNVITIPATNNNLDIFNPDSTDGATTVLVDFYVKKTSGATQINIAPESFGGNFYIEASTLFRNEDGKDMPAEFIIPNAKVQSNFTFSMASSGDPSTFTFTIDAFPDGTRFNPEKKVLAALQIITEDGKNSSLSDKRTGTGK